MKVHNNINSVQIRNPYVTVGVFDGVHLGHQFIINNLINTAKENDGETVLITFWPHPKMVIQSEPIDLMMINTLDEKLNSIKELGIDHFLIIPFTYEFSLLTSEVFIDKYLHKTLNIRGLIVGFDHRFGKDREGNFEVLKSYATKYNFMIKKVDALKVNEKVVSSTVIRNALLKGEIEIANSYLTRNYSISGNVTYGNQIGRNLGFPTANLNPDFEYKLIPCDGVYAVKVNAKGMEFSGMLNIGNRPTFNSEKGKKSIEVHILNFAGNLYNEKIEVSFCKRIRDEIKFNSADELTKQLIKDKNQIENYFEFYKKTDVDSLKSNPK